MFEHAEELVEVELAISDLKEKLEELLLLERLRKGEINKKKYEKEVKASYEEKAISRGTYEHLMLVAKKRGFGSKKALDREAARTFVDAYNLLAKAKKAIGLGAKYIELEEKGSAIENLKNAIVKTDERPKPVRGGKSWKVALKSLFIKTGKEEVKGEAIGKVQGLGKVNEIVNKIRNIFSPAAPEMQEVEERFYVPAFATDAGLAEKQTKKELTEKKMFEKLKKENIVGLKEKLFAEGEKSEPLIESSGLITLIPGYAYAKIVKEKNGKKVYYVIEPDLTEDELKKIELIKSELIEVLTIEELTKEKMFARVESIIRKRGYTFTRQGRHNSCTIFPETYLA